MGEGSYAGRIALAQSNGMVINPNVGIMTLAGLIMGFWVFYGYYIPTFFAGEVKQAETTLLAGSWASLISTWAIFVVGALLLQRLVPLEWIAAESFLSQTPAAGVTAMPYITFYAAILRPSFILVLIVAVVWIYTLINLAQTYFFYCSRIVFAWSFDRLIPERICWIHPKLRSPIWAILIIALIAEIGVIDSSGLLWAGGVMGAQLNFVFFAVCTMFVPVTAITLFPFLKKDLFENASAMVRRKIGPLPGHHAGGRHHVDLHDLDGRGVVHLPGRGRRHQLDQAAGAGRVGGHRADRFLRGSLVPPQERGHRHQLDVPVDPASLAAGIGVS